MPGRPGSPRSEERRVGKECRSLCDWSSDVCSSDLVIALLAPALLTALVVVDTFGSDRSLAIDARAAGLAAAIVAIALRAPLLVVVVGAAAATAAVRAVS